MFFFFFFTSGVSPFSEAETQALTGNMLSLNAGDTPVKASFSIHSYGQLWLFAYGWSSDLPADYDEMVPSLIFL